MAHAAGAFSFAWVPSTAAQGIEPNAAVICTSRCRKSAERRINT